MVALSLPAGSGLVAVALVFLYLVYRALLPKPLPDIPYNQGSASRLFGDIPEMMRYVMRTKRVFVRTLLFLWHRVLRSRDQQLTSFNLGSAGSRR